jgi:type I restriction enzyme S subunit
MVLELPNLPTQQKHVDIYKAMVANQQSYERGLEDLKLVCDGYIEDLRRRMPCEKIGAYIRECNEKNDNNAITLFQGVTVDHVFTDPKRVAEDSENGSVVRTGQFAFNKVMKAHNTKLPIALREGPDCVVSNSYQVFEVIDEKELLAKYLLLWMNRVETQRYAGFISFGTTRDIFSFEDMGEIFIPIPNIETQQAIVNIFTVYQKRVEINEHMKAQIKDICPILIRGSLEEGR